jgi:hypothetical protein
MEEETVLSSKWTSAGETSSKGEKKAKDVTDVLKNTTTDQKPKVSPRSPRSKPRMSPIKQLPLKMKTFNDLELDLESMRSDHGDNDKNDFNNLFNASNTANDKQFKEIPIMDEEKVILCLLLGVQRGHR